MKLIHLSDLHLGKRLNEYALLEDQRDILKQILAIVKQEAPDGVVIAGDLYDKLMPSGEAVQLCDEFLVELAGLHTKVFVVSGNHDSAERVSFGGRLMAASGVYLAPIYDGRIAPISLQDEYGEVLLYLLPFVKPLHVRRAFPDAAIDSYTDALRVAVNAMGVDDTRRNVLVTHQFVTGAARSESEEASVGGTDNVDASVFAAFDYVALGHIHGPQNIGSEKIRYCGTPLKYSFSEAGQQKSVTVVELREKGSLTLRTIPLTPLHDMRELRGSFESLCQRSLSVNYAQDYLHITLTDEDEIPDAVGRLRLYYPLLMKLDYDNARTRRNQQALGIDLTQKKSELELFAEFYEQRNNQPMSETQRAFVAQLIEELKEDA